MGRVLQWLCIFSVLLAFITAIDAQGCQNNPCQNGARCEPAILLPGYVCLCSLQWIGRNCDFNVDNIPRRGPSPVTCSQTYFGTTGLLTSPNWPDRAGINELCLYSIRIPTATRIDINLNFFISEFRKDDLYYTTGPDFDINDNNFGFNGNQTRLGIYSFETNQMTFVWESDFNIHSEGFNITYSIDSNPCINNLCRNGAICVPSGITYTCQCPVQFSGEFCGQAVVLVENTLPFLAAGAHVVEGRETQTVSFNLRFEPSALSVGNVIGSGLWRVDTFLSSSPTGAGSRLDENQIVLNVQQGQVSWVPPTPSQINNLQGQFLVGQAVCSQMNYLCATIGRGANPSVDFALTGDPNEQALVGCAAVPCVGVEIFSTRLAINSGGTLREGFPNQNIGFDITMSPRVTAGSVSGSNLWKVTVFGSTNPNGAGTRVGETQVNLNQFQAGADVILGQDTVLQGISAQWNLNSGTRCAEIPYFCALVEKNDNPSPDFFLSEPPQVACQPITCRGVEVTSTSISVTSGNPIVERRNSHQVTFNLNIGTNPEGGRVIGNNLWAVDLYYSTSDISGIGVSSPSSSVVLTPFQSGTDIISPGLTTTLQGLSGTVDLSSTMCRNAQYVCAILSRNPASNPLFSLSPSPGLDESVMTSCAPVQCQGVIINNVDYTLRSSQPLQASTSNNVLTFDFVANSLPSAASVSGQNLWQLEIFANTLANGQGTISLLQTVNLPFGTGSVPLVAGSPLNLNNLQATFDLRPYACIDIPFLCLRLSRNQLSNPEFTITGTTANSLVTCKSIPCSDRDPCDNHQCLNGATCLESGLNYQCLCAPGWTSNFCQTSINVCNSNPCQNGGVCQNFQTFFTCTCTLGWEGDQCQISDTGVIMQFVRLLINSGTLRQASETNPLNVNVELNSNPSGNSIAGSGLWQVTIYPSTSINGLGGTPGSETTPFLNIAQSGVGLVSGGQATITDVDINLNVRDLSCSDIPYICVRVAKGQNPNPNFLLGGSLVGCTPSNCRGVDVTRLNLALLSGFIFDENTATNTVQFHLGIVSDPAGGSASGTNLWSINTFVSNQPDGSGTRLGLRNNIPLTNSQGSISAVAGITTQIQNVASNVDLSNIDCSEFQYFCAELTKGPNPSMDFDIVPPRSVTCVQVTCNGVTINSVFASINGGFPVTSGQTNLITFDFTANASPASASINGNNLWQIQVYTSPTNNGNPSDSTSQQLATLGTQAGLDLVGGGSLEFTNIQGQLDLTNVECTQNTYVCFDLQANPGTSVPFTLDGNTRYCQLLQCTAPSPCSSNACFNGGACVEQGGGFICNCPIAWVGFQCQTENPCLPVNPCLNGATCLGDNDGTFQCLCVNGYTGFLCNIPPDPCNSFPCSNGGACSRIGQSSSFQCTCTNGYSGQRCQNRDRCILESPCLNGAVCLPDIILASYQCLCPQGFKGINCQYSDICFPNPCLNQGTCSSDQFGQSYTCNCRGGFQGVNCQTEDLCFVNQCLNAGTCVSQLDGSRLCTCLPQYSGNLCQFNNPCQPSPCLNQGTCLLDQTGQSSICRCTQGFSGPRCEFTNPCQSSPCLNGGLCQVSLSGSFYTCSCNSGLWTGANCNTAVVCVGLPCFNGGTCFPSFDASTFTCQCQNGFGGTLCSIRQLCNPNPCLNGGNCNTDGNTFTCSCPQGFLGTNCQIQNPCQPNPCSNGGQCAATSQGLQFTCTCPSSRFYGPTCNFQDGCAPQNPCLNGGICSTLDVFGSYSCNCPPGWTGTNCNQLVPCGSNPCLFGGQCFDDPSQFSGYRCVCVSGYTGLTCNIIDLCSAAPCYNGGTCTLLNGGNNYACACFDGYFGDQCHMRHPCNPNPCLNGGLCNSITIITPVTYTCTCLSDFTGVNCGTNLLICPNPSDYMCLNGACVSGQSRCNVALDCPDFSDETSCPLPCQNGMFQCTSILQCISSLLVCDGTNHCNDGSDEGLVCQNPCEPNPCLNQGVCSGSIGSLTYTCVCTAGFSGQNCGTDRASNDAPQFIYTQDPTVKVTEGQSPSIVVFTLNATDPDGDPITYDLFDDAARSIFTINQFTGQLYALPGLDYETLGNQVIITVSVTDGINDPVPQTIYVRITDVNDIAPTFTNLPNITYVFENATFGSELYQVITTDEDTFYGGFVTYSISLVTPSTPGSAPNNYFSIGETDGIIQLATSLNYEEIQQYFVTVVARDYGTGDTSLSSTATLTVSVLNIQDTNPVFLNIPYDVTIPETLPVGSTVQTITATDPDSNDGNIITYNLVVSDSQGYFVIDQTTGIITVNSQMDRDNPVLPATYPLIVSAVETSSGGVSFAQVSFNVTVSPANDEPPMFDQNSYSASIPESASVNSQLPITITVNDGDLITDSTVTVSLQNGNSVPFRVSPTQVVGSGTVDILITQPLDFENNQQYTLQLQAVDGDGQDIAPLMVTVTDVNDNNPVFINRPIDNIYRGSINENDQTGTFIVQVSTTDADSGSNAAVTYSIISGNINNVFTINPTSGAITNTQILGPNTPQTYTLSVRATNPTPGVAPATGTSTSTVIITVNDVNDSPPRFSDDEFTVFINEAAQVGTTVTRITATDEDIPEGDRLTYIITAGNTGGHFQINPVSGDVTLLRQLDRELESQHNLTIRATDQGAPPQSATTTLKVIVLDFNDNAPQWSPQSYVDSILENVPLNTFVLQVVATDADQGTNADLSFTINNANNVPFVIDDQGNIRTSGPLNRETVPQYNFLVTVLDNGSPQQAGNPPATVTINILDVNDEPPVLDRNSYEFTVSEDVNFNTFVGQVTATDPDLSGTLTYTFVPADPDFSYISGTIRTNTQLDANQQQVYQMTVFASDGVQNSQSAPVTINVLDVNNQAPSFGLGTYVKSLPEDSPFQTLVVDLNATDPDNGNTGLIIYSFESLSRTQGPFTVDPYTGVVEISTTAGLDRETQDEYTMIVIAVDQPASGQPMTGTATVSVIVTDVNDNAPTFRDISYEESIFENHPLGSNILTVQADDPDLGVNAVVLYRIISGNNNNLFNVDGQGNINLGSTPLDREMQDQYFLIVQAYNSDLSVGTNEVPVIINILDINDVTPLFQQQNYYRPDLSENSPSGTPVLQVFAQDQDLDLAGDVQYSLIGNPNFLTINSDTGVISVNGPIADLSGSRNFTMTVRATDQASPFLRGVATVTVTVVDDTVTIPIFTLSRYPATVIENVNADTPVTRVSATLNGNPAGITYAIDPNASPAVLEIFKIDENTGHITTEGAIDREVEDFYAFTVFAYHEDSVAPGSTSVWVNILDENDNPPEFITVPPSPVSVTENTGGNVPVGLFRATDPDTGINAQMTFSISGAGSNFFNVFQTANGGGTIVVTSPLDRERQDFYQLTVTATDGGNPSLSSSFPLNITVTDVNDNYPIWTRNVYEGSINENNFTSNPIITVMVNDLDLPSSNNFEYSIIAGDPMGMFEINSNGEITVSSLLDREQQETYQLTIELIDQTNSPPARTTTLAIITVGDENDNTPIFAETVIRVDVTEGPSSQNIPVYMLTANDIDLGLNRDIIYAIGSQQPQSHFQINPETGMISTTTALDWETISEYTLIVTATDQSPTEPRTGTATVIVSVNDINDGAPMFVRDVYGPYSVVEEVSNSYIDSFQATDTDQGLAGTVTYSVIGQYSNLFFIQPQTGVLTIRPDRALDYETITEFNITVVATDMGNPALSSSTLVGINVININDHTPIFEGIPYTITLSKNISAGSLAYVVRATDDDAGIFGEVRYQITDGNTDNIFRIDQTIDSMGATEEKTGEVFVQGLLETGTYRLVVEARDTPGDIPSSRASSTTLTIVVTDIGDLAPTFPGSSLFTGNVFENAPVGQPITMIPPIRAINSDATGQLVYTITGPDSQTFMINQLSAGIQVNGPLDRETKDFYEFGVIVTDSMGLTAMGTVHINVLDVNDFAPAFNDSVYNFTIPENSPGGYYVGGVSAYDLDGDNVNFFIQTGGEDKFDIGGTSGTITVTPGAVLDREEKPFYTLTVMVSDLRNPPLSGTATVYIYLIDINDSPPKFDASFLDQIISIPEDTPGNTIVTTVTATDDDLNSNINYQIVSVSVYDEDDVDITSFFDYRTVFSLNPTNGNITLTSPVDREVTEKFVFSISARDLNSQNPIFGTSQENAQVTILITDINDNHPAFQPPGTTFILRQLPESFGAGSPIPGNLLALDPDLGLNGEVMYIIQNPSGVPVTIDQNTGQLTLLVTVDREQQPWVNLTVLAVDKGTPSLNTSIPVYLEIIDNNDNNPVFGAQSHTTTIIESEPIGAFVFNVNATDADSGGSGRVTYSLIGGDGKFTINQDSGVITLLQQVDKETQSQHMLTVFARDNPGDSEDSRTGSTTVIVNVLDANEFPPVVTQPIFTIDEGGIGGEVVGVIEAYDPDDPDDPNQSLYYVVVSSQPEVGGTLFIINNATGEIITTGPLDRDNNLHPARVDLDVIVYDDGNPNLGTPTTAIIYINDLNDNQPTFDLPLYDVTVVEGQYSDPIITVVANDPDQNSNLRYEILGGNLNNTFVLVDGGLIPVKPLDFETFTNYNLTVVVTDDSGNRDTTYVAVTVTDANDHNPTFVPDQYSLTVTENEPPGTQVGAVITIDGDTLPEYTDIIYTILTGNGLGNFTINSTTGIITTATILDREKTSEYVLTIGAENPVGGTTGTATVSIIVRDVNDNTPTFEENPYISTVTTNTLLVDVHANDPDEGGNGIVIYEIVSGNEDNRFQIDNRTGVITLVNPLDSQLIRNYTLVVIGHDLGNPRLQSNTTVDLRINYLGLNAPPSFVRPNQGSTVFITENNPLGQLIINAFAVDDDVGANGVVDYSILPNFDYSDFTIDPVTGDITILVSADREIKDSYTLTVVATDRGDPNLSTSSTFVIRVLDENDNNPAFPRPDGMNNPIVLNLNVFENANISDLVGTVDGAIDLDLGANGQIFYHIVDSTVGGIFVINSTTGVVTVNGTLDREDIGVHTIYILATNDATYNGTGPYNVLDNISLKEVKITLLDINDNAPRFTSTVISACIPFDISLGMTVVSVAVVDLDGGTNLGIAYSLNSIQFINSEGERLAAINAFTINSETGQIVTNQRFGEAYLQGYFDIVVQATDVNTGQFAVASIRLCILNNNQRVVVVIDAGIDVVRDNREILIEILQNITGGIVFIDDITTHRDEDGVIVPDSTQVLIHVVDPNTGEVLDANLVTALIDENAMSIEVLFDDLDVIAVYPLFGGGGLGGLGVLEAALLAFGILLFLGALIFAIILCCLRRRLLRKMQGGGVTLGKAHADLLKENRSTSYQGSNPLWLDADTSQPDDWPDSISLLGGTVKDYEAQEATMNFLSDEIPVEIAEDAVVMTSMVSDKSVRNKMSNGGIHRNGYANGFANGSISTVKRVDTTNLNGGTRTMRNNIYEDGTVSAHMQQQHPWGGGGGLTEEHYSSTTSTTRSAPPPRRTETDSRQFSSSLSSRSTPVLRETQNSLRHRKMLTEQTAAEIREMLQDMPPSHLEQQSEMAAAAYREQMEYEAELTPITEEGSMSSRSTNTRGSSYRGQDSLERNKRNGTISKQYQDPMGKFAGESSLEEQYKEEEINGEDSKTKIKTYSAKRVSSKVYTGGEMVPIPELDSADHMLSGIESRLALQDEHSSMSGSSSPQGRSFTYQVLPDSGGSNAENPSVASHTMSSQSDDSGSRNGEFNLAMMDDEDDDDADIVEERRVRRTIKRETSGGDGIGAMGGGGGGGRGYSNNGFNDEESAL
ncbi:cadherin-23 isoform X4 [Strongylocentrotus purpuratus]|uniref:Uncharacterized protein n=1 Tax=Strongylocentrotus purpuratus TaxID=7668 RepID=A0A7M7NFL6_STRPU|nr:cadherin-23 isoform X4 [Strongylocentrotus purpuratus]